MHLSDIEDKHGPMVVGMAQSSGEGEDDTEYPAAVLWMPDPTSKSGWCDRWVKRQKPDEKRGKAGYRV